MVNRKELNPNASPQAAFGARLRSLREARGLRQDELGALMGYSGKHISAIETGRKTPSLPFSRATDVAFGLEGTGDTFERAWRELKHGALLEGFPEYVGYESRAVEIRLYEVGIVPGLLQTPEYASALAEEQIKRGAITPAQAHERVSLVAERQVVLARTPPPLILVVLDESCIRRPVGEPEVMREQLSRLLEFAERPNTALQVADFAMGARRPFDLPVTVATLPDRSLVFYAESAARGHVERDGRFITPILTDYHHMQKYALPQAQSLTMIDQVRKGTP
ncbi:helix-turn-helix domain-containing protein [Streptomyces sp. NPDC017979]|uniref:helix-turn-helix domain-containing protein n=1 Tax=Streptomyces sp. NPDC017979 TaxID=3365024 RepID=UPI0037934DD3